MRAPGRLLPLALLVALAAAPGHAQDAEEECPNPKGWELSEEELRARLRARLRAHQEWLDSGGEEDPAVPGRAVLCNAFLQSAQLQGAVLVKAELGGADLRWADIQKANLRGAKLSGADLVWTDLGDTYLRYADLRRADLRGTDLQNAHLAHTDLTGAVYAPASPPPDVYVAEIKGLKTVTFPPGQEIGLMQLRKLLQDGGLRDLEQEATYAIERQITCHKLRAWREQSWSRLGLGLEGMFRRVAFEWPVAYGLYPGRALRVLLWSIGLFALVYVVPLSRAGTGGIHRVWPPGHLEARSSTAEWYERVKVERLRPRGWWGLKRLLRALQFSVLSAFHLGWRELNVGTWLARLQTREYTLQATGWVRAVAGFQSLLSVYLLALWALTYFGRPFQ